MAKRNKNNNISEEEIVTPEVTVEVVEAEEKAAAEAEEKAAAEAAKEAEEKAAAKEAEEKAAAEAAKEAEEKAAAKEAEEKAAAEAAKEKAKVAVSEGTQSSVLTPDEIKVILIAEDLSGVEKLNKIAKGAMLKFGTIASKLLGYNEHMYKNPGLTPATGVGKQYDLLNTLKAVLNTEDYNDFKVKFDIVNMAFRDLKKEAYNETHLYRYDQQWKWSKKDLVTLQHLLMLLIELSNGKTRAENKKKLDLNLALSKDEVNLSDTAISNIKKYY